MTDFWTLIDQARGSRAPHAPSASPEALHRVLANLSNEDLAAFATEFNLKLIELNRWDLWGAGYVIADGMGDDSFHYFRSWIIGKGRECYDIALRDPGSLGPFVDDTEIDNELLEYVALELLEARGLKDPRDDDDRSADDEPNGEPFDEDTVFSLHPNLADLG